MKRLCATALLIVWGLCAFGVQKSETIVYINGAKFYVHTIQPGETLYALSKEYGVGEQAILQHNPAAADGLKVNGSLRIPFVATVTQTISDKKLRKEFNIHTVVRGETLYNLSRMFEIPISTIVEDNPNIDPIHLKLGQTVLIRKKKVGSEDEAGSRKQWEEYRQTLNKVTDPGVAYHIVNPGETFYSLSHRFGITEAQLSELNGGLKASDLKVGAMLKIPAPVSAEGTVTASTEQTTASVVEVPETLRVQFHPLRTGETLNISLLLPLMTGTEANNNYLEFYQGFLLGLDSIRTNDGHSVKLSLYNTSRDPERVREIVEGDEAFRASNLIIGPVYEETLHSVVNFAEQQGIPVVSPLASLSKIRSEVMFQMAPDPTQKYRKVANLIDGGKRITLIYSNSTDKEFEQEIKTMLGDTKYGTHTYRYVHGAGGASDLTSLLDNGDDNVFVVLSDNETEVDRILAAMASADTSITSRGRTTPTFVVLGNARWNRYNNIDRTMFFKDRVIFISTYHAKRDSSAILAFDSAYMRAFGTLPTLYSYRGYDAAMVFAPAMYNDIEQKMTGRSYTPLQTTYVFGQDAEGSNNVNANWMRVNYNSDFTITVE